jgi:hypothetical protein
MKRLAVLVFLVSLCRSAPLFAQVNPVNDFSGGVAVSSIGGDATDATRHTLVGWQAAASQKIKKAVKAATTGDTPISIVGDFGGQFRTLDDGRALHAYEYMGGVRVRAGAIRKPTSVFAHALVGGMTRSNGTTSDTGLMMGLGGGIDVVTTGGAYALGVRTQFDWLPARVNSAWVASQFRIGVGVVIMARYWD